MGRLVIAIAAALLVAACGSGNVFSLGVGECFQDPGADVEVSNVEKVDCGEPHGFEVYALFDLDDGGFPGGAAMEDSALQGCFLRFDRYVGNDYASSALDFSWLVPTSASWDQGDREVVCTLVDFGGGTLTGSMKDSGA